MRNLKKSLALVIVFVMLLGVVASAAEFNDVALDDANAPAITMLADLGVLQGDAGTGNYRPDATLSRVEACAVIYRMTTGKQDANNFTGVTKFSDVAADYWGTGYINYCTEIGVVNGYPDGTFLPDQPVNYGEFVTMLVRALGLDKTVKGESRDLAFPAGFIAVADIEGINGDVSLGHEDDADRASVAQLAYNAIMNATYRRVATDTDNSATMPTVAEYVFGISKTDYVITSAGNLGNGTAGGGKVSATVGTSKAGFASFTGSKFANINPEMVGLNVDIYLKDADESKIYAVVPTDQNKIVTVNAVDMYLDGGNYYYKLDGSKTQVTFSPTTVIMVNGRSDAGLNYLSPSVRPFLENKDRELATVTLISNDGSDKSIEFVNIKTWSYASVDVVESNKILFTANTSANVAALRAAGEAATADYSEVLLEVDDEACAVDMPEGLKKDDRVIVFEQSALISKPAATIKAVTTTTGTYSKVVDSTYTIAGGDYKASKFVSDVTLTATPLVLGTEYKFSVDPEFGYIVKIAETEASASDLYFVVGSKTGTKGTSKSYDVYAYNSEGKYVEFSCDATPYATITSGTDITTLAQMGIFELSVNKDGKITDAVAEAGAAPSAAPLGTNSYNATTKLLSYAGTSYSIKSDSVVFYYTVKSDGVTLDKVYAYVGTFPSVAAGAATVQAFNLKTGSASNIKSVSIYGTAKPKAASSDNEGLVGYVMQVAIEINEDDDAVAAVKMLQGGKIVTYNSEADSLSAVRTKLDGTKDNFIKFDLLADGTISLSSVLAQPRDSATFGKTVGTSGTYTVWDGGIVNTINRDNSYITVGGTSYEFASDVAVYVIEKSVGDSKIGTTGSIAANNAAYTRKAWVLLKDDEAEDYKKIVTDIFYYSVKN